MTASVRIRGLPVHPFLVHFPIAFWLAVPWLDLAALTRNPTPWAWLATGAAVIGLAVGVLAIAAGLLEYLNPSLAGIDMRLAARHGVRTTVSWCVFLVRALAAAIWPVSTPLLAVCLVLDAIGCALLVQGVWFGTRQVYEQLERD